MMTGPRFAAAVLQFRVEFAAFGILVLGLAAMYWPALSSAQFFGDDFVYVVANPALQRAGLWQVLTERVNAFEYLPLRDLSYWIDWRLFGPSALAFRLHGFVWYLMACVATWVAALQLAELHHGGNPHNRFIALAAATIFALHPLHVEAVAWVASRKDLMSGCFVMAAAGWWAYGLRTERMMACWMAVPCFFLALACKTVVAAFPIIAMMLWLRWARASIRQGVALFLVLTIAAGCALLLDFLTRTKTGFASAGSISDWNPVAPALRIAGVSLFKALVPVDLRLVYDELFPAITPGFSSYSALGMVLGFGALVSVGIYWRSKSLFAFGVLWFSVFLLPYLQLVPTRTWSLFSDRFAFISVFGVAISIGWSLARISKRGLRNGGLVALSVLLAALSFSRIQDWRSVESLLINDSGKAKGALGIQEGVVDSVYLPSRRYAEARLAAQRVASPHERRVLELRIEGRRVLQEGNKQDWMDFASTSLNHEGGLVFGNIQLASMIGIGHFKYGLFAESESVYRTLVQSRGVSSGERADARYNLALAVERQGRFHDAVGVYREVIADEMTPRHLKVSALNSIGALLNGLGDPNAAEREFSAALTIDPAFEYAAVNLANLYRAQGRQAELDRLLKSGAGNLEGIRKRFPQN